LTNLSKSNNLINHRKDDNKGITAIVVQGNESISKDLIMSQITSNLGDVFFKKNIEKDIKAIHDLGYFKDVKTKIEPFRDGYKVIFVVIEYLSVKEINIEGNTVVSEGEMREVMVLQEGQIFCQKLLKNDLDRISQLYKDRGYLLINIKDVNFDEQGNLWITISEGRLGKILVEGNHKTKEHVIAQEISINPGDLFDFEKVKKSLQKIYNLGYFEDVSMKLEPENEEGSVVLIIKIVEKSKIRNSMNFILKNVLALFFFSLIYMRLFLSKLFYKTLNYLPKDIHPFITSYISIFIIFSFVIILSFLFLEKRFYKKDKLQYFISYFKYLFLFPITLSYKIIEFLFYLLYKIIKVISNIFKITRNIIIQIILFIFDIILICLIMRPSINIVLVFSISILMILLILHLHYLFNIVINPNLIYLNLYNFIENIWTFYVKKEDKKISKKNNLEDIKIQQEGLKIFIKVSVNLFNILKKITNIIYSKKGLLYAFILLFIISILLTILIFSFEYYGLSRINNYNFNNLAGDKYFEYLYSSMTIYSTVHSNNIIPLTVISKLFVMLQILLGIVLFYTFIVSFQTVTPELATLGKQEISKRIELNLNYLENLSEREFGRKLNKL